ncbi:MAG: hypothetical protein PHF66_04260, partial [Desulfobacteraceae bacterium]|nr:hypothetical protein [Desulfobacteraceae bacterium]
MTGEETEISGMLRIAAPKDLAVERKGLRDVASTMGFNVVDSTRIVTAAVEIARNIIHYAGSGEL